MIEVKIKSPNGPKVVATEGEDEATILAALPRGWTVHDDDWNNGVKLTSGAWSYPICRPRSGHHANRRRKVTASDEDWALLDSAVEHALEPSWTEWALHVLLIAACDELGLDPLDRTPIAAVVSNPRRAELPSDKRAIVERLLAVWERHPRLRLGQLIEIARGRQDLFNVEDRDLVNLLERWDPYRACK